MCSNINIMCIIIIDKYLIFIQKYLYCVSFLSKIINILSKKLKFDIFNVFLENSAIQKTTCTRRVVVSYLRTIYGRFFIFLPQTVFSRKLKSHIFGQLFIRCFNQNLKYLPTYLLKICRLREEKMYFCL